MQKTPTITTLSEIPKGSKIKVDTDKGPQIITFHHLDGMYSYCTNDEKETCHLSIFALLREGTDGIYELVG